MTFQSDPHEHMQQAYELQRSKPQPKERWAETNEQWKNRFRISAKVKSEFWPGFYNWAKQHKLSYSSAVNVLISTHPDLKEFHENV